MSDIATAIRKMQEAQVKITKTWNEKVQPVLSRDPRLPAQFIIDCANSIVDNVITPVDLLAGKLSNANAISSGLSVFPSFSNVASVQNAINGPMTTMDFLHDRILAPLAAEAHEAIASGGKRAMVAVVISGGDRFDQVLITSFQAGIVALTQLSQVEEAQGVLFKLAELCVDAANAIVGFMVAIGSAIASVGIGLYDLIKSLIFVAKVAAVGAVGYMGYKLVRAEQERRTATQNPARRRRRRSRGRPYGYLR